MIIRRHKCEVCGTIYPCDECTEIYEHHLVHDQVDTRIASVPGGLAPECLRKFECEECNHE